MGFTDALKKMILPRVNEGKKISPEETELEFYRRRHYMDNVKRKLRIERARAAKEHMSGSETLFKRDKRNKKKCPEFKALDGGFL